MAELAKMAKKMMEPNKSRYRTQQNTSVHLLSAKGPSLH
jgi:hypothetical protein